jgi:hypothetical protein
MKFAFYILFILLLTFQFSQAQNVSGKWYGVGKVEAAIGTKRKICIGNFKLLL